MKAIYNDTIIAESDSTELVEGNHYFPPESIKKAYFTPSDKKSVCPWKGKASYYTIHVGDDQVLHGAWYYPSPSSAADHIKGYLAFSRSIQIEQ